MDSSNITAPTLGYGPRGLAIALPDGTMVTVEAPRVTEAKREMNRVLARPPQDSWTPAQVSTYHRRLAAAVDRCRVETTNMMRAYGISRHADGSFTVDPFRYGYEAKSECAAAADELLAA